MFSYVVKSATVIIIAQNVLVNSPHALAPGMDGQSWMGVTEFTDFRLNTPVHHVMLLYLNWTVSSLRQTTPRRIWLSPRAIPNPNPKSSSGLNSLRWKWQGTSSRSQLVIHLTLRCRSIHLCMMQVLIGRMPSHDGRPVPWPPSTTCIHLVLID